MPYKKLSHKSNYILVEVREWNVSKEGELSVLNAMVPTCGNAI